MTTDRSQAISDRHEYAARRILTGELPIPVRERWQPLRVGLMNVFLFEDERFPFADGRMLLRGTNGTGKSRVLAMTLPLLLDGSFKATRVEPDRDHNRQVAWNILMDDQDSATGYSWLEFGRLSNDPSSINGDASEAERFLTIGCGMRAKRGQSIKPWFFITERRVDKTLALKSEDGVPLTQRQLTEVLGSSGQVYDAASDYRRAVDEHLFRLGERYDALIDLLLQLRQPKLAEKLDIVGLESTLREALPPLQESLLNDAAEAFLELDQYRTSLESDRKALQHIQRFLKPYRDHARRGVKRSLKVLTTANSRYETAQRELRRLADQKKQSTQSLAAFESQQRQLKIDIQAGQAAIGELQRSPEVQNAQRLNELAGDSKRLAEEVESRSRELSKADEEFAQEMQRQTKVSEQVKHQHRIVQQESDRCRVIAAPESLQNQHQDTVAACLMLDKSEEFSQHKINMLRHAKRFHKLANHLANQNEELAKAKQKLSELKSIVESNEHNWQTKVEVSADSATHCDTSREELWNAIMRWRQQSKSLHEYLPAIEHWALLWDEWTGESAEDDPSRRHLDQAKSKLFQHLIVEQEHLRHNVGRMHGAVELLQQEAERLESGQPIEPPVRAHRAVSEHSSYDDGVPFWTLVDFELNVPISERGNWEAAIHDAGLLDAVLLPNGKLIGVDEQATGTQFVETDMQPLEETLQLSKILKPTDSAFRSTNKSIDEESLAARNKTLQHILTVIGMEQNAGQTWVASDGRWRNGPLHGKLTKQHAQYIGEEARRQWREWRLQEIVSEQRSITLEIKQLSDQIASLETQKVDAERLVDVFPSSQSLIAATSSANEARKNVDEAFDRLEASRKAEDTQLETFLNLKQQRDEDAADFGLSLWTDRALELCRLLDKYVSSLETLGARVDALATVKDQLQTAMNSTAHARERAVVCRQRLDGAKVEQSQADEKVRVLREGIGQSVDVLLRKLESEKQRQKKRDVHVEELSDKISDQKSTLAVNENDAKRRQNESQQYDQQRREATDDFAELHRRELLALVIDESEIPAQPWAMTTAIRLARLIDGLLENVPADEETWLASQNRLHRAQAELQQTVLLQGGLTVEVEPLRDGLQMFRFVLQGERLAPTTAAKRIEVEITTRERILDEKEQDTLEKYLLGEVADGLRKGIAMAAELVELMTAEVSRRPMKTGMQMRFRWRQDDEGPPGLAEACEVLAADASTWSPEERDQIKLFLQRSIRQQREEDDTGSWHEHMQAALDYRRWHRIIIERRKGPDASWIRLTRKTYAGGSGGEKAVALTLPPLAAAAAYYQSADPLAPRFILLDEAFAGISSDNRESCMELIVDFGLDAVLTSENEWCMYTGVPQIAICQLDRFSDINAVVNRVFIWNGSDKLASTSREDGPMNSLFNGD